MSYATSKNSHSQYNCDVSAVLKNMFSITMIFTITIKHKVGDCIVLFFEDETSEGRKRYYNES